MSEPTAPPDTTIQPQAKGGRSAGAVLRHARESAGLHIGALAGALKVPVNKLEALEADRLDLLPDAVFARALAASLCRILKIDPTEVLSLLPGKVTPPLQVDTRLGNASFDRPHMGWQLPLLSRVPRSVLVIVALLVVAALVLMFVPSLTRLKPLLEQWANSTAPVKNAVTSVAVPAAAAPPVASPIATAAPLLAPSTAFNARADAPAGVATPADRPASGPEGAALAGAAAQATEGIVVLKARANSWVQVVDASGTVQLRKTMAGGETAAVSGPLPIAVTIGRADSIEVLVRGKPFDLASVSKDNVARFQIK
ncbi:MAG: helix-turn-helix domain-containing protein [Burkholderiaceae bacterium]